MYHLCHELLGWSEQAQEISGLWEEYEAASTPEALLVKDFDKFEMIMQALEYEQCELPQHEQRPLQDNLFALITSCG